MTLDATLQRCLQQIEAGESIDACLARYPDQAAELAPMLAAAVRVRAQVGARLTETQRFQAKAVLRQTLAAQASATQRKSRPAWTLSLGGVRRLAAVAAIALLLVVVLSVGVVASSEPGNPAYAVRVIAERAPALVNPNSAARTAAELAVADRRLADLQAHLERAGRLEPAALRALLAGDEAAARQAVRAGQVERLRVARRLATHARLLRSLAERARDPRAAQLLNDASRRTLALAARLRAAPASQSPGLLLPTDDMPASGQPSSDDTVTATLPQTTAADPTATTMPTMTPTPTTTSTPTASPTPADAQPPSATQTAGNTSAPDAISPKPVVEPPQVEATVSPRPPRPRQTAFAQTATARAEHVPARAETATARAETATERASRTPGPGPRQTAMARTATAMVQTATPEPSATSRPDLPVATATGQAIKPAQPPTRAPVPPPQDLWRPQRPR